MLIAHTYAWLYHQTGEARFRDRGDQIFEGGTKNAYLLRGKQFDRNYRLSFEYVRLRKLVAGLPLKTDSRAFFVNAVYERLVLAGNRKALNSFLSARDSGELINFP